MTMKFLRVFWLCVYLLLIGCFLPESNHVEPDYYLLSALPSDSNLSSFANDHSFYLREVEIPKYLQDSRMIMRSGTSSIRFRESKRWGEPLEDGIGRVLSLNLAAELNCSSYSYFPHRRKDDPKWDLSVSFSSFEIVGEEVLVAGAWSARHDAKEAVLQSNSFRWLLKVEPGAGEVKEVRALNEGLRNLSREMTRKLNDGGI